MDANWSSQEKNQSPFGMLAPQAEDWYSKHWAGPTFYFFLITYQNLLYYNEKLLSIFFILVNLCDLFLTY